MCHRDCMAIYSHLNPLAPLFPRALTKGEKTRWLLGKTSRHLGKLRSDLVFPKSRLVFMNRQQVHLRPSVLRMRVASYRRQPPHKIYTRLPDFWKRLIAVNPATEKPTNHPL